MNLELVIQVKYPGFKTKSTNTIKIGIHTKILNTARDEAETLSNSSFNFFLVKLLLSTELNTCDILPPVLFSTAKDADI